MDTTLKQQAIMYITALPENASFRDILRALRALRPKRLSKHIKAQQVKTSMPETSSEQSFLEAARRYAGCIKDAPPDLSTNPRYMEGYGE